MWLDTWLPRLKEGTPEEVLAAIRALPTPTPEATKTRAKLLSYLRKRIDQIQYAQELAQPSMGVELAGHLVPVAAAGRGATPTAAGAATTRKLKGHPYDSNSSESVRRGI